MQPVFSLEDKRKMLQDFEKDLMPKMSKLAVSNIERILEPFKKGIQIQAMEFAQL